MNRLRLQTRKHIHLNTHFQVLIWLWVITFLTNITIITKTSAVYPVLWVLQDLYHSTLLSCKRSTESRSFSFQIASFLHFFLVLFQSSGLNCTTHQAMQSPPWLQDGCRTAVTAKMFFSLSFVRDRHSSHKLFWGWKCIFQIPLSFVDFL